MLTIAPAPGPGHQPPRDLAADQDRALVHRPQHFHLLPGHFEERHPDGDAGIVHQPVKPPVAFRGLLYRAFEAVGVGHVGPYEGRADLFQLRTASVLHVKARDLGPCRPALAGDAQPDPGSGAGNDHMSSTQVHFTAPAVAPAMILRWKTAKRTSKGSEPRTAAGNSLVGSMPVLPTNL